MKTNKCIDCETSIHNLSTRCNTCSNRLKSRDIEIRKKISMSMTGKANTKGHTLTQDHKAKISKANKGKSKPPFSEIHKQKIRDHNLGKKHTDEERQKISKSVRKNVAEGKHNFYIDGRSYKNENKRLRNTVEYKIWRDNVFKRDKYTCQDCGIKSGIGTKVILNADHIKPFSLFPDLRFDISNGRTLCIKCHEKTDTYRYKIHQYKKTL